VRTLTSAGRYGYFVTDIRMTVDPASRRRVLAITAANKPIVAAAGEQQDSRRDRPPLCRGDRARRRPRGRQARGLAGVGRPRHRLPARQPDRRRPARRDARRGQGRRRVSFINSGGVRTRFVPGADGTVTYGQIFALQPFGNSLVVLEMTGTDLKRLLEEQFGLASRRRSSNRC
jgi:5'-nucleotidase